MADDDTRTGKPDPAPAVGKKITSEQLEQLRRSVSPRLTPEQVQAIKQGLASMAVPRPEVLDAIRLQREANDLKYAALIQQAQTSAVTAQAVASSERKSALGADPQVAAIDEVRAEIQTVATIVGTVATTIEPLLEVARDAYDGLLRLEAAAEGTRAALVAGQEAADNAAGKLVGLTRWLVIFTVTLVGLTLVLVWLTVQLMQRGST